MRASERGIVLPITFGSMFEWYEVFLYIYWAPLISSSFFDLSLPLAELIHAALVLSIGLIARPIGGLLFGYIGDKWGRKVSFLLSILLITLPSIAVALMPNFTSWAYSSIIYIGLIRFFQGIPAGGELPGALCLLSEGASLDRKRYLCSFLFVGPQIGQIISMLQCLLLEQYLTHEQLINWGWRISFLIGGAIGITGFFLRKKLHESVAFENLKTHHKIEAHPLRESFKHHKKNIAVGFFISIFEVIGFFMIYFFLLQHSSKLLNVNPSHTLVVNLIFLITLTAIMPFIGYLGDKFENRPLFKLSALGIIFLSTPFYFAINQQSFFWTIFLLCITILLFCIQFSLLPSLLADLFPTQVRFTCIGFSFNITDGIIGGIMPFIGTLLLQKTGSPAAFIVLFPITAIIFLIFLRFVKLRPPIKNKIE
ncbi:MAG: MFS transporter [Simkaniaceae bacterium]|nr:MFS transporter [Candidatus Sacchlamyda saccharinae]